MWCKMVEVYGTCHTVYENVWFQSSSCSSNVKAFASQDRQTIGRMVKHALLRNDDDDGDDDYDETMVTTTTVTTTTTISTKTTMMMTMMMMIIITVTVLAILVMIMINE